jgi:hypothetical protein
LLAATLYQGNHDRNHKLWNIGSTGGLLYLNGKFTKDEIEIVSFVVKFCFKPVLTVNLEV